MRAQMVLSAVAQLEALRVREVFRAVVPALRVEMVQAMAVVAVVVAVMVVRVIPAVMAQAAACC